MQMKKIVPLALALTMTATASAGAAEVHTAKINMSSSVVSQARQQMIQKLMEKFDFSACFPDWDIPSFTPDGQPEETPDGQPEEAPEETPDNTPEEIPEETPDEQPEEIPDEQPEEIPDNTPQQPDNNRPEETPDNGAGQTPDQDNGTSQGDFASQVVALVNAERAKQGLSALKVDTKVQQAALVRAQESAQSFSHTSPNGASFSTGLTEAGGTFRRSGENIAYGQSTPQHVMNAWMNSSGHRANILNENFTTIGVGYTVIKGTAYWAQLFTA